ncbi:MAG: 5'-3' exonuclease H3TH domain-containing protein [bacterium]
MPTIFLIDASPYIFRAYFSLPTTIQSPDGKSVNAVYGFTEFLLQILKKEQATHIAVAFDGSLTTSFRNEIYPQYKANRDLPPPELEAQLDACFRVTEALGVSAYIDDRYEADDIIATLAQAIHQDGYEITVVSGDKDLAQLVNERITFWDFAQNRRYDIQGVKEKFQVLPEQIIDLLALMGDSVDNIPGVKGIGRKSAVSLLRYYRDIEDIYNNIEALTNLPIRGVASMKRKLLENREMAFLSKRLAALAPDAPIECDIEKMAYLGPRWKTLDPLFSELGFDGIKERVPK